MPTRCAVSAAVWVRLACRRMRRSAWAELKVERHPRARYAHTLARMANRLFLFGGEANAGEALVCMPPAVLGTL